MATPAEKLADSLAILSDLQDRGTVAIRTGLLTRTHRERLLNAGFIHEVMKGWYIPAKPDEPQGESTGWYASFWAFCSDYLNDRFGAAWSVSPEQSIRLHVGDWTVPKQLLVRTPAGGNKPTSLLYGTSIFDIKLEVPSAADIEVKNGLRLINLPASLVACAPTEFASHPDHLRAALAMLPDPTDVLRRLLDGGHSTVAGRLAGAFRNIGRTEIADRIVRNMRTAGYTVNETDPFTREPAATFTARETSPYINRLELLWAKMREPILEILPAAPGLPKDPTSYLEHVDDIYTTDAYNSLSIEGYRVSEELINRVRAGNWNADANEKDRADRDALAARGYWQAFQSVKESLGSILNGENPGNVIARDYDAWHGQLFGPSVTAGIIKASDLAGFRAGPVVIRRSMHVPPSHEAVRELMPAFFDHLRNETEPAVRAVLGHFAFVYIHPYMDGNGRMGRFLMNAMMAAGGYGWTVIPVARRADYMAALETASVNRDIRPFATLISGLVGSAPTGDP